MASVVGIDFGNVGSKIGVARQRGIDVIANEVSNRVTPSLISFGPRSRAIGESAKTLETSNFKNTIGSLKRLVGRQANDPEITEIEKKFINAQLVDVNATEVGVKVNYLGEPTVFSATQLVAMYFHKLADITANELKHSISDVVISVPGWFSEVQRRAILDAANIAGLNPLRLINDTTAIALGYGITKSDLPDPENPRHVVFVDIGHSNYSVAVVAFAKGELKVKSAAFDRHFGGRDLDLALVQHFAHEFKDKYKIDVLSSQKATFRLATQCERLKKVLSANFEAPLAVENIMNDIDASSKLNREQFESLITELLTRVTNPLQEALQEAGLTAAQIDAVELVGGTTRVPAIKDRIKAFFGNKALSTTLNADEAVARGATFACAKLSPVFKVRNFEFKDIAPYSIKIQWQPSPFDQEEDTELVVFPRGNELPSTKLLTFYRESTFEVEAVYAEPSKLPGTINPWIGKVTAKIDKRDIQGEKIAHVKVKTRLNGNGLLSFEGAYLQEETEEEVPAPMDVDPAAAPNGAPEQPSPPQKKKKVIKRDIPIVPGSRTLDPSILNTLKEQEANMHASDKLIMDTEDRKNALEEYVYDMRSKVDDKYAAYVQPAEKEKLLAALQDAENWLYSEEGEDATKSAYVAKLDHLHALGDPITKRYKETEQRSQAVSQLREAINLYHSQATSNDERFSHIDEKDKQTVVEKVATVQKWLDDQIARQAERPKNVDPVLTVDEILKKREEILYMAIPIFSKPKPKPRTETPTPAPTPGADGRDTPQPGTGTQTPDLGADGGNAKGPSEMDVD